MMTFTSALAGMPLVEELLAYDAAMAAFTRSLAGRSDVVGYVSARDISYSRRGAWNPHRHMILIVRAGTNLDRLQDRLIAKWLDCIRSRGGHAIAAAQLIREVQEADDDDVIAYVLSAPIKVGDEDAGDTVRDITVAAGAGDRQAIARLNEYACALKGRRAVSSGGLLRLSSEPFETEIPDDDRVVDLDSSALLDLDSSSLLDTLTRQVGLAVGGDLKKLRAHEYLSQHLPDFRSWYIDWTGHENIYYSCVDPGPPFEFDGPEWDEPEFDASCNTEMARTRLEEAIGAIMAA